LFVTGAAERALAIDCSGCHGNKSLSDFRPVDSPYRNITTGGFRGNHQNHLTPGIGALSCIKCHPGASEYSTKHRNGQIEISANINNSPLTATYRNGSTAFPQRSTPKLGRCNNVNCHFEQDTPTWGGAAFTIPDGCANCHGMPPSGGTSGADGSHTRHNDYYPGSAGCSTCHPGHTSFGHATSAGRAVIVTPKDLASGASGNYSGPTNDYLPSQNNRFGVCTNMYCHSNGTSLSSGITPNVTTPEWGSPSLTCISCHASPPDYVNGTLKTNSHQVQAHLLNCSVCHQATTTNGSAISSTANHVNGIYTVTPDRFTSMTYTYSPTGSSCSNTSCHAAPAGARKWGALPGDCNGCHESPPDSPSHVKHFSGTALQASYTSVSIAGDSSVGYLFNCANCHPRDPIFHRDGTVQVELHDPAAPAGSVKLLNPSAAQYASGSSTLFDSRNYAYTNGTCSNVYCHSYNSFTTPTDCVFTNQSGANVCDNYAQANLQVTRIYRDVTWNSSLPNDCSGCHANAPRSDFMNNDGMTGDSHAWGTPSGIEQGHFNKEFIDINPTTCSYCHNDTVKTVSKWWRPGLENPPYYTHFSSVPISGFAKHVNGRNDVAFEKSKPYTMEHGSLYDPTALVRTDFSLTSATYVPETKTCNSVSCHLDQTSVKWGKTYRGYKAWEGYDNVCLECHSTGYY
jgi:predicted CxxxxCH...CXXCH cytochrome family protein